MACMMISGVIGGSVAGLLVGLMKRHVADHYMRKRQVAT